MTEAPNIDARPLGAATPPYGRFNHIIGDIDISMSGNTIMRVGQLDTTSNRWEQVAHVVLTPAERERLIDQLLEHRDGSQAVAR